MKSKSKQFGGRANPNVAREKAGQVTLGKVGDQRPMVTGKKPGKVASPKFGRY